MAARTRLEVGELPLRLLGIPTWEAINFHIFYFEWEHAICDDKFRSTFRVSGLTGVEWDLPLPETSRLLIPFTDQLLLLSLSWETHHDPLKAHTNPLARQTIGSNSLIVECLLFATHSEWIILFVGVWIYEQFMGYGRFLHSSERSAPVPRTCLEFWLISKILIFIYFICRFLLGFLSFWPHIFILFMDWQNVEINTLYCRC